MGDSKVLKNHRAKYALRSDRNYVAFEEGAIHTDLNTALKMLAEACPVGELKALCYRVADAFDIEKSYDDRALRELQERSRQFAWRYMHEPVLRPWADFLLMFLACMSSGIRIETKQLPKEDETQDADGDSEAEEAVPADAQDHG